MLHPFSVFMYLSIYCVYKIYTSFFLLWIHKTVWTCRVDTCIFKISTSMHVILCYKVCFFFLFFYPLSFFFSFSFFYYFFSMALFFQPLACMIRPWAAWWRRYQDTPRQKVLHRPPPPWKCQGHNSNGIGGTHAIDRHTVCPVHTNNYCFTRVVSFQTADQSQAHKPQRGS